MAFATLGGVVSNIRHQARHVRGGAQSPVSLKERPYGWRAVWHAFEVGGTRAQIKLAYTPPKISEGDRLVLIGKYRGDVFIARALRNETTGHIDASPTSAYMGAGAMSIAIGVFTSVFIIGLLVFPIGCYLMYQGYRNSSAAATAKVIPLSAVNQRDRTGDTPA